MSILRYVFDIERIIRKYWDWWGSWLRNDIFVLFIELFRVQINQRSASRSFSLSLLKLGIVLPLVCGLWNRQKHFAPSPLFSVFPFCLYVGFSPHKTKCQYFLRQWCGAGDPVPRARTLNCGPVAGTPGGLTECLWTWGLSWTALDPTKEGCCTLHRTPVCSQAGFQF